MLCELIEQEISLRELIEQEISLREWIEQEISFRELIEQEISLRDSNRELLYRFFVSGVPYEIIIENITNATICIQHTMLFNNTNCTEKKNIIWALGPRRRVLFMLHHKKVDRDSDRDDKKDDLLTCDKKVSE